MTSEDKIRITACKFCGQTVMVEADTEAEALHEATMRCNCDEALRYQEIRMRAEDAGLQMSQMYKAENVPEEIISQMYKAIDQMVEGRLQRAQLILPNGQKLQVTLKGTGFIVEHSQAEKKKVEV